MFIFMMIFLIFPSDLWARTIVGIAEQFGNEAARIAMAVGMVGLVYGGLSLAVGKQDGGMKITFAVIGLVIILARNSIKSFLTGLV